MPHKQKLIVISIIFLLFSGEAAYPQRRRVPEDQIKLAQQFYVAEGKCSGLLRNEKWREAEVACKTATRFADRFADYRELEKLGAYGSVGLSLMGQKRYEEAIKYYARAIDMGRPRLDDTNAEVGQLYGHIATAYHRMHNLDKAREFYRKAARTFLAAYSTINPEAEHGVEMRQRYIKILKAILENHLLAAEQAGAAAEIEDIKKQMETMPLK